jgi:hypothetical protein
MIPENDNTLQGAISEFIGDYSMPFRDHHQIQDVTSLNVEDFSKFYNNPDYSMYISTPRNL